VSNSKHFQLKLRLALAMFFFLFLLVGSVKISPANCVPGLKIYDHRVSQETVCPNSGLACTYEIWEEKHNDAICIGDIIMTTLSPCRIRESEVAPWNPIPWYWPRLLGGNTLRGPCFQVVGSAPCSGPGGSYEVTIWWQYVNNWGSEAACDFSDCFFCVDNEDDIPMCGLENSTCPYEPET